MIVGQANHDEVREATVAFELFEFPNELRGPEAIGNAQRPADGIRIEVRP